MQIQSAEYKMEGRIVRIRLDRDSNQVVVMVYGVADIMIFDGSVSVADDGPNRKELRSLAGAALCAIHGYFMGESLIMFDEVLGSRPDCTNSEVSDFEREIERFLP